MKKKNWIQVGNKLSQIKALKSNLTNKKDILPRGKLKIILMLLEFCKWETEHMTDIIKSIKKKKLIKYKIIRKELIKNRRI